MTAGLPLAPTARLTATQATTQTQPLTTTGAPTTTVAPSTGRPGELPQTGAALGHLDRYNFLLLGGVLLLLVGAALLDRYRLQKWVRS